MAEICIWIVFQAHPSQLTDKKDQHPDFFGHFICPSSRRDPEELLAEVLSNRKLFLAQITSRRTIAKAADWGMQEQLKTQVDEQGYGLSLTKVHRGLVPFD
jgi:hypothetical protein